MDHLPSRQSADLEAHKMMFKVSNSTKMSFKRMHILTLQLTKQFVIKDICWNRKIFQNQQHTLIKSMEYYSTALAGPQRNFNAIIFGQSFESI